MDCDSSTQPDLIGQLDLALHQIAKSVGHLQNTSSNKHDQLLKALFHVFPYASYRSKRQDLVHKTDEELVYHFVQFGINEGVVLEASHLTDIAETAYEQRTHELKAKLDQLQTLIADYSSRLTALQELFMRLSVDQCEQ